MFMFLGQKMRECAFTQQYSLEIGCVSKALRKSSVIFCFHCSEIKTMVMFGFNCLFAVCVCSGEEDVGCLGFFSVSL